MSGQGHVTAVHLATGAVSEHHIPRPRGAVAVSDLVDRNWWRIAVAMALAFNVTHTGSANTLVAVRNRTLYALEEASRPYKLHFDGVALYGGEWTDDPLQGVHVMGDDVFSYQPLRTSRPLTFNGVTVNWSPAHPPVLMHSYARANASCVVFPLISTRLARVRDWLSGAIHLPLVDDASFSWMVLDTRRNVPLIVECVGRRDPLHVLKARPDTAGRLHVFSVNVRNFLHFLRNQDAADLSFALMKDVIDVASGTVIETVDYGECGDFPNRVSDDVYLLTNIRAQTVHFFNTRLERVMHSVRLNAVAHDVQYADGYLLYCTLDCFIVADACNGKTVYTRRIPKRTQNFHSTLVSCHDLTEETRSTAFLSKTLRNVPGIDYWRKHVSERARRRPRTAKF